MKRPLVMFGDTRSHFNIALLRSRGWGRMFSTLDRKVTAFEFEKWGFDNGAFKTWQDAGFPHGLTATQWRSVFCEDLFAKRLAQAETVCCDPYIAVVPDIPASRDSLAYSVDWRRELMNGWNWYLAVQDGMQLDEVEDVLHMFAGIFLGGSDSFKLTAYRWARLAHKHGRRFHYARAGTPRKIKHAFAVGSDSLDSTFACWTKQRTRQLVSIWDGLGLQAELQFQ